MLKSIEAIGKTEDEAIASALSQLGMSREEVSVEVLERAKSGFLGIGASPAKVKVSYEVVETGAEKAEAFLNRTTHSQEVELLEGHQQIYWGLQSRKLGLYLTILCCAYETFGSGDTFEVYNADYKPVSGEQKEG